jgi:hypothetical protein
MGMWYSFGVLHGFELYKTLIKRFSSSVQPDNQANQRVRKEPEKVKVERKRKPKKDINPKLSIAKRIEI